jgi:hypothetical protein
LIEYTIDTGDSKPIKLLPRRVPMAFAGEEKKIVSEMYEQGIIQKSNLVRSKVLNKVDPRTVSKQSWIRGKGKSSFTVTAFNRR